MPRSTRQILISALCSLLVGAAAAQDFAAVEMDQLQLRRALRHDELIERYQAVAAADPLASTDVAGRVAALSLERESLTRTASLDELRSLDPLECIRRLTETQRVAGEDLACAEWLFLVAAIDMPDAIAAAETLLARARDHDPSLDNATDAALAAARGEAIPEGGYHRYRGRFMPLALRDRARGIDDALEALADLALPEAKPPFVPSRTISDIDRFLALGPSAAPQLIAAAAAVRATLRPDYDEVRGWLRSYARSDKQRAALLDKHLALAPKRAELLQLIARYDKPEQPEVDTRRTELEAMYSAYADEVARDRSGFDRVRNEDAYALSERIRTRERALAIVDACVRQETGSGIDTAGFERPPGAATGEQRLLPGRDQSGLEDVLWLLVQLRAGQVLDVLDRGADLQRLAGQLTPWEQWLTEELIADATDRYNDRIACSLDATERDFVAVLNRYRRVLGRRPFELEERMNAAARKHSQEMVDLGYFGHVSPVARNRGPSDRVRLEGYGGGVGENCLAGHVDGRGAFEAWYHSPGHHRGMIAASLHLGVGAVNDHGMWTMVMGGTDLGWRALHRDLDPARLASCQGAAQDLVRSAREGKPSPKEQERLDAALAAIDALLPDVMPDIARLGFETARDDRHALHDSAPLLLGQVIDAELPVTWRPLQVAAVAAAIDLLRLGATVTVRQRALDLVRAHCPDTFGYAPESPLAARQAATLQIRALWEDHAQWTYRRAGAPPEVASIPGRHDGPSAAAKLRVLAKPARLKLAKQFGGGSDTEQAIERGLEFLARVQEEDGAWRARAFVLRDPRFDARQAGLGNAEWDIAMAGLSLLAFVSAGHTTDQGDYQETVRRGVRWLASRAEDFGKFETVSGHYMYGHAIATQALCEVYAYTADPYVGAVAQLAIDYIVFAQDPDGGGWRYDARQAGDTSVVGWCVMALSAGYKAGLDVSGFRDAVRFLDAVTQPGYYPVGYTDRPGMVPENLRLTAVGMASRLFLGQAPTDAKIALPSFRLLEQLPDHQQPDFYYWYYGTLVMFQVGDAHWKTWNAALKPALLGLQETDRGSPLHGSWPPDGAYGGTGGRIYQTALGVLLLTTYYRYDRAPKIKVHPFTGNLHEATAPFLDRLRSKPDAQEQAIVLRKMVDEIGPSLVPVLIEVAGDSREDESLRVLLSSALITVAEQRHQAMLLPLLGSDNADVAANAMRTLVEIGSEQSAPALIEALQHGHHAVRAYAATALGRLGITTAVAALDARAKVEEDGRVKNEIAGALRAIATRDDLADLVDAALPPGTPGRLSAFEGLALLEAESLTKQIHALRESEPRIWEACVGAVRTYGGGSNVPVLIELLRCTDVENRQRAIKLLGAVTRQTHGFVADGDAKDRGDAIRKWEAWWKQAGEGYGG